MTDPDQLTEFLHQQVPLTRAMQVRVVRMGAAGVQLTAPFAPNRNLHGTAFGGSLATLAVMAGWCAANAVLQSAGGDYSLVVKSSHCDYLAPARAELVACASMEAEVAEAALRSLRRHGRARLPVQAWVECEGVQVLRMQGEYAAV